MTATDRYVRSLARLILHVRPGWVFSYRLASGRWVAESVTSHGGHPQFAPRRWRVMRVGGRTEVEAVGILKGRVFG